MKIIQVSDLHLVTPGRKLFGADPLKQFEECVADINRNHPDADLVIFSGDLTNDGKQAAYAALAERIGTLVPPFRLMLGNHDHRARFRAAFPGAPEESWFVHSTVDLENMRIILLDTLVPGHVGGRLCRQRLDWLDRQLQHASDALVFLHHPPFRIGIPSLDECRLDNPAELLPVLKRYGNVQHIFAGHVHRQCNGIWNGIPFTTVRSTNHQSALKFTGPHEVSFEAPSYTIILANDEGLIVHSTEFRPNTAMERLVSGSV